MTVEIATKKDLVIRIAGESGEGVISTGDLVTQAAARAGFEIITFKTYPAEIKGGHCLYQLRLSDGRVYTEGDALDILIAFNQEAYDKHYAELKPDGMLLYDPGAFEPPAEVSRQNQVFYAVPLAEIARTKLKFELGKNVVGVGVIAALFGLPREFIEKLLQEKFAKKGEDVVKKNLAALDAGIQYVEENIKDRERFLLKSNPPSPDKIIIGGNLALALGAIAAGCRNMYGYPITPASDILEFLAAELPKLGGVAIQAEDEIASIGMVMGASYAGHKAMTSTSGPGVSLMVEWIGYSSMAEIPAVIVDVQRAGPSTGMPTKHEQGDLNLAVFGAAGEAQKLVIAPVSVTDCFWQIINAFNLTEKYQLPCILLSDTVLATRTESISRPNLAQIEVIERAKPPLNGHNSPENYRRYEVTETGVSPMSVPGMRGGQYVSTGLEHSEYGRPRYDVKSHSQMTEKRFRKLDHLAIDPDLPPAEQAGNPDAEIGIITWGSTWGDVVEVVREAEKLGIAVEALAPKVLWPLPTNQLDQFMKSKRVIICPEVNYTGQFAELLKAHYLRDIIKVNTYGGAPFKASQILEVVVKEAKAHV